VAENASALSAHYGNVSKASAGARENFWCWRDRGAVQNFGEPALKLSDLMRTTADGRGVVSVLVTDKLMSNRRLYSTFLV